MNYTENKSRRSKYTVYSEVTPRGTKAIGIRNLEISEIPDTTTVSKPETQLVIVKPATEKVLSTETANISKALTVTNASSKVVQGDGEISEMVIKIKNHLSSLDTKSIASASGDTSVLKFADQSISAKCMLSFMGATYYPATECSDNIRVFLTQFQDKTISELLDYSAANFKINFAFYKNLNQFILSILKLITDDQQFKSLSSTEQNMVLEKLRKLIKDTLNLSSKLMDSYQVINEEIITINYGLMLVLYKITNRQVNIGTDIKKLEDTYTKVKNAIQENIKIYRQLNVDQMAATITPNEKTTAVKEIEELIKILEERLKLLEDQKISLAKNIDAINKDTSKILENAGDDVKQIVIKFE